MKSYIKNSKDFTMRKWMVGCLLAVCGLTASAQDKSPLEQQEIVKTESEEVVVIAGKEVVVSSLFKDNWFVLGDFGANAFWGDYTVGNLTSRLAPQFNIGVGKWFVPELGAKFQLTGFRSKELKSRETLNTRGSETYYDGEGNPYWKENIKWWDFNVNVMFNLSRMIAGFEGIGSTQMMNQFIATAGVGLTHQYGVPVASNSVSGHVELQYSRFFSEKKDWSLDVRLRGLIYGTEFDRVAKQRLDENLSLNVGVTYYLKERGWKRTITNTTYYVQDRSAIDQLNEEIGRLKNMPPVTLIDTVVINQGGGGSLAHPYLVNFVINKTEVVNRERVNLKVVAEMMKATPEQKYLICGYADKYTGSVARNTWLAEQRAKNVFQVLTEEFGVPAEQLVLDDKGGVDNMYYDDPQLSRSAIISKYEE